MYITTNLELEKFCASLSGAEFITVDTEFCRDKTYYPQLCLIQIASKNKAVIIDALSEGLDLLLLEPILQDQSIVKVFHSAKHDLEILLLIYKRLPRNIFDTQIAASFCGIGDSISYESLVSEILGIQIDKSYCLSDWTKRPLSQQQIDYALGDVTYLREIYSKLLIMLKKNDRLSWMEEEIANLNRPENFIVNVEQVWSKLKNTQGIRMNLVIKKLAAWREAQARLVNLPRNHYLREQNLFELASVLPITLVELRRIKHFLKVSDNEGQAIIKVIQDALNEQVERDLFNQTPASVKINSELLSKLKLLLNSQAEKFSLPARIIATTQDLKDLCSVNNPPSRILKGWRYKIFGELAINLKNDFQLVDKK